MKKLLRRLILINQQDLNVEQRQASFYVKEMQHPQAVFADIVLIPISIIGFLLFFLWQNQVLMAIISLIVLCSAAKHWPKSFCRYCRFIMIRHSSYWKELRALSDECERIIYSLGPTSKDQDLVRFRDKGDELGILWCLVHHNLSLVQ